MADNCDLQNVSKEEMGALYNGDMRFTPSGLTYKNRSTGKVFQLSNDDIESVSQNFMANQPGLRFITKDGELHRFANFTEGQLNKLKTYIATKWRRNVEIKENSLKGWNFGNVPIVGKNLQFQVNDALDFEIPLSNVSNCTANKSEAILEFHANDDSTVGLVEMRLHMPMVEGVSEEESPAELLRQAIMKYAAVEAETEQHIVLLTNMLCLTPRGRYDIKIFPTFLSFHGKTYDYKIPARSVNRLFMLKHKDGRRLFFVMHINPPIRQGQTRYSYIVFEFSKDELAELELSLTDEQLQDTYEGKIERHLNGPLYQIVAKLFRVFVGIKVTVPGGFTLTDNTEAVTCSHKQTHGHLYPMDKGFMYVPKPPIYIRHEEIANVNFARSDISTKTFDLEITTKGGTSFVFSSVAKDDFDPLLHFCKEKNLPVQNAKTLAKASKGGYAELDDDVDPYKERLKSEAAADSDESDSDEEDEDFDVKMEERKKRQKGDDDSDATDGTEPDEEYDTGSAEELDSDEKSKKPSPKKKDKKEKAAPASSSRKKAAGKKQKDPNAPKRATSAYFHWMNEIRPSITKPGMGVAEVAKEAGRLWKEMSDADKKPYEEKSKEDKERYDRQMKEYKASGGSAQSSGKSRSTPKKSSTSAANTSKSSPTKGAKSREFLSSSEDSDDSDDDAKKKKSKSSKKEEDKEKSSKKKAKTPSESEDESSDASDDSD